MSKILGGQFMRSKEPNTVYCVRCDKTFKYHHSTSSLSYHLKSQHGADVSNEKIGPTLNAMRDKLFQSTLEDCGAVCKPLTKGHEQNLIKSMALWIAKDSRPVSICEDKGLENVLRVATNNVQYTLPSRGTIKSRVDKMYAEMRGGIENCLSTDALSVCLTCDYWTSAATENYLGITVHYITSNFSLQSRQLGVSLSEERHTADNIVSHLNSVTEEWKLDGKVGLVTHLIYKVILIYKLNLILNYIKYILNYIKFIKLY